MANADASDPRTIGPPPAATAARFASHLATRWPAPPSWSPEGRQLAVEWPAGDGGVEVLVVSADRDDEWLSLTQPEANEGSPAGRSSPP